MGGGSSPNAGPCQGGLLPGRRRVLPELRARQAARRDGPRRRREGGAQLDPADPGAARSRSRRTSGALRVRRDLRPPGRWGGLGPRGSGEEPARGDGSRGAVRTDRRRRHPVYYPLYAKCIELDLPVSINTGIPGPPMPGECQDPMYLDRVCLHLPRAALCMAHGADPWWGVAIRLMIKYQNLHLMTSAYSPKYLPPELIHFMNTRGQDKILFASDHPVLPMSAASPRRGARPAPGRARQVPLRERRAAVLLETQAAGLTCKRRLAPRAVSRRRTESPQSARWRAELDEEPRTRWR